MSDAAPKANQPEPETEPDPGPEPPLGPSDDEREVTDFQAKVALTSTGLAIARQIDRVVGIWIDNASPRFVRLPDDTAMKALVIWNDAPFLVVADRETVAIVRVP